MTVDQREINKKAKDDTKIIALQGLSKTYKVKQKTSFWKDLVAPKYKQVEAVKNISFEIKRGELVGFVGPNGAGKTTTIKMLTGILWPTNGTVSVLGMSPQKQRKKVVARLGAVFGQRKSLWPELSVIDGLELIASFYGVKKNEFRERYHQLSKIFEINKFERSPFRKLSLGQQMRAELCAALLHKPEILLLDEPTIGLDIVAKQELISYLKKLNRVENITILLTSHDLHEIENLCERIIVINHGRILYDGTIKKIIPQDVVIEYEQKGKLIKKTMPKKELKVFLNRLDSDTFSVNEIPLEDIIRVYFEKKE